MKTLDGLVVVSIEQAVAAPFCTMRLADAGARVIKIERPEGDFARGYDTAAAGQSSYFVWLNRGKESVVLDLRCETDRHTLETLIAQADVLVQNLKPGAMARLSLGVEELRARHPRLICCSISGYGEQGPYARRKAYDLLIQADSGLASITGGPQGPARVGISVVDIATGATAHAAILEALIHRGQTGRGLDIRISMFDVIAEWLTVPLLHAESGHSPARVGLAHPSIAPYGAFATCDGRELLVSVQSDREWKAFCTTVLQRPELALDRRFQTNVARVAHRMETDAAVSEVFSALDAATLIARLESVDIAFSAVNDMSGLSRHPHLRRATIQTPGGPVSCPAPAFTFDGVSHSPGAIPGLGAHGANVAGTLLRGRGPPE